MNIDIPNIVSMESKPCPLGCSNSVDEEVFKGWDRIHDLPGEFLVVRCSKCGLMRTDPRPTADSIGYYYPDNYGPYNSTKVKSKGVKKSRAGKYKHFIRQLFQFNTKRIPKMEPGNMLEIGCASGEFLHEMAQEGWNVTGIEFSQIAAENARNLGYPVYVGSVESSPEPEYKYELIVGWMVLEHLHDPVSALKKLERWMKPGGHLVISVPNAGSLESRVFGNAWYANHLPNHLYHFTTQTIRTMLSEAGWEVEKIYHQRILSSLIVSVGYVLLDKGVFKTFAKKLVDMPAKGNKWNYILFPTACFLALFGQTGRMTIWAKKK